MYIQRFISPEILDRPIRSLIGFAFLALSFASLVWSAWVFVNRQVNQASAEREFEKLVDDGQSPLEAGPSRPARRRPVKGPVAKLEIARLGVAGFVEEGIEPRTLQKAIGMALSSARPGEPGNVVLAGHRDTFFAGLRDAKSGDLAVLRTVDGRTHRYRISRMFIVDPTANWVMQSSPKRNMLTLITCYPFRYVGRAPQRFIVQAEAVDANGERTAARSELASRTPVKKRSYQ